MIECDVAIVICSRGREDCLTRLLSDLRDHFAPALLAGGLTSSIWVYAQGYAPDYLAALDRRFAGAVGRLVVIAAERPHTRIGDVVHTALSAVQAGCRYRLAMLMDDDSLYEPDPVVAENLRAAARRFIDHGHRAYSIKLGSDRTLAYERFVDLSDPIMPFKEKMMWVGPGVIEEVLSLPRFAELSIGEDAVIAAVAWLSDPEACFGVHGLATFLHLGFEGPAEAGSLEIAGGYADLMEYTGPPPDAVEHHGKYDDALRRGVTPHHILPDIFVPEDHRHYIFNGVRSEVVAGMLASGLVPTRGAAGTAGTTGEHALEGG